MNEQNVNQAAFAAVCKERDEALALLASEKSTRNAIIAKGLEMEKELQEAREALSGRTVSCSQCNEAAGKLEAMREAIQVAHAVITTVEALWPVWCGTPDQMIEHNKQQAAIAKLQTFLP